jgi:hypothetical protein
MRDWILGEKFNQLDLLTYFIVGSLMAQSHYGAAIVTWIIGIILVAFIKTVWRDHNACKN